MPKLLFAFLAGAALFMSAVYWGSLQYFRAEETQRAAARLTLYRGTVEAELQRFAHMTFVLARDPYVIQTLRGGTSDILNGRLQALASRAGLDAIFLMDTNGTTIAASNFDSPMTFIKQNYAFRPYFKDAMEGKQAAFFGIGATSGIPGYFIAESVNSINGFRQGVIAIKIGLSQLQESWQTAGERVFLTDEKGVVLLASDPAWRFRTLAPLDAAQLRQIAEDRQFGAEPLDLLDWSAGNGVAELDGARFVHLSADDLTNGWTLHYLTTATQARTRAALVSGTLMLLLGIGVIALQVQRTRRIGSALRRSVGEEAALRAANERLAIEITERREAERQLQKTQTELERAGRLAALGQLASSVTHELGQPIAAMRNHIAAAEMQPDPPAILPRMQALIDRMEGITRQLKFFSRKGRDQLENVDLRSAVHNALELVSAGLDDGNITFDFKRPDGAVLLHANRLRMEQVVTNLLRNAVDAVEGAPSPRIEIQVGEDADMLWLQVIDNGHGLGDKTFAELQEPFATTKPSGAGMGLGLTISAGIVTDHGGMLSARSLAQGAVFRAEFPKTQELAPT